jgi:hypothetical protein
MTYILLSIQITLLPLVYILGKANGKEKGMKFVNDLYKNKSTRCFFLTDLEDKEFTKSQSKSIRFDLNGIGTKISYLNEKGEWQDITDYGTW